MAADLVSRKVDVIIAAGSEGIVAARNATQTIPIVMTNSGHAVGEGFAASLSRPGGNITGLTQISPELAGKRLQVLKEFIPRLTRIAVLWHPFHPNTPLTFRETQMAAATLGLDLLSLEIKEASELDPFFTTLARDRIAGLVVLRDPFTVRHRTQIADLAKKLRIATVYETDDFVEAGGLVCYGPDLAELFRRSAIYVDKIVKGARAADLPIEQPTKFDMVINLGTAKAIGLAVSPSLLMRSDRVIQ